MLIRNDVPILEYDTARKAILEPNPDTTYSVPGRCVFGFLGEEIDRFAERHGLDVIARFESVTKTYPIYRIEWNGVDITLCQAPCGAAPATQLMDFLIGCGADRIVSVGGCGVLVDIPENELLIPVKALRDEGTSYQYLPPARDILCDPHVIRAIETVLDRRARSYEHVHTWTTDGFFRETKDMVAYRIAEGCTVVDMECAALAACAEFRGVRFGQLLFTCDSLADADAHDMRTWGAASFAEVLEPALDAAALL